MVLQRAQILLDPEQYRRLKDIAQREQRSFSNLVRQLLKDAVDFAYGSEEEKLQSELSALDNLRKVREQIREQHGVYQRDLLREVRQERERQMDSVAEKWDDWVSQK